MLTVVVHAHNPSYLGGRGRSLLSLRLAREKVRETIAQLENTDKRAGGLT
jgi:hypothetical protein